MGIYLIPRPAAGAPAFTNTSANQLFKNWATSELLNVDLGGASGGGRLNFGVATFARATDVNSPVLLRYAATGARCDRMTVYITKPGANGTEVVGEILTLGTVSVTAFENTSTSGDNMVTESISVLFGQLEHRVYPFSSAGVRGAASLYGWDTTTAAAWNPGPLDGPG
jgi:type VI protein secretion system component Hcp